MRRTEAVVLVALAVALIVAGLAWLFGPLGLIGAGLAIGAVTLFVFDVKE